jgi:hypothetical protein
MESFCDVENQVKNFEKVGQFWLCQSCFTDFKKEGEL